MCPPDVLSGSGIMDFYVPAANTKKLLFLLDKFELVKAIKRGNLYYYYASMETEKINFGGHFDKVAARMSAMQFYVLTPAESRRLNAINSVFSPIIKNTNPAPSSTI